MRVKENLIGIMGTAHPRLVSRLGTFGIGLAIVAVVATGVVAVGGGAGTLQQAYAQQACPEGYTFNRGLCTAAPIPGGEGGCPDVVEIDGREFTSIPNDEGTCNVIDQPEVTPFCPSFAPLDEVTGLCTPDLGEFGPPPHPPIPQCVYADGTIIVEESFAVDCEPIPTGETVDPLPSSEPSCPDTENFREPEIVNGECQVRPGEGEPEPGDDEVEEVEEEDE